MDSAPIASPASPTPSVIRRPSPLRSIVIAMLVGALIAVTGLYVWGSQIAAEQAANVGN